MMFPAASTFCTSCAYSLFVKSLAMLLSSSSPNHISSIPHAVNGMVILIRVVCYQIAVNRALKLVIQELFGGVRRTFVVDHNRLKRSQPLHAVLDRLRPLHRATR